MFNEKQKQQIAQMHIPEKIFLPYARDYDDTFIYTAGKSWKYYYSGSIRFAYFPSKDLHIRLIKHLCYRYLSRNLATSINRLVFAWGECLEYCESMGEFNFPVLQRYLDNIDQSGGFYEIAFGIRVLCYEMFDGFTVDDYDNLEFIARPQNDKSNFYKNENPLLDNATKTLIATGIVKFQQDIEQKFNTLPSAKRLLSDLRDMCILALCYVTGARPSQIARLCTKDLREDSTSANLPKYSLYIPYAKQTRVRIDRILIAIPYEVGRLLSYYIERQELSADAKLFPKWYSAPLQVSRSINAALLKLSPENYQQAVVNGWMSPPCFSATDFRHNVGHSLAMQGVSAEEIAYILGHSSLVSAKNYIQNTPTLAMIRHQALGSNPVWQNMIAMMVTGNVVDSQEWHGARVANLIGGKLHTELGGCSYEADCLFSMVRNCYGCLYFRPFSDGNHQRLLASTQDEHDALVGISDSTGNSRNSLIQTYETTLIEIQSVINRCHVYKQEKSHDT